MIEMSSEVIRDFEWCFGGMGGISGQNELIEDVGGEWRGGRGLRNDLGR
jgi:hypothetical protein